MCLHAVACAVANGQMRSLIRSVRQPGARGSLRTLRTRARTRATNEVLSPGAGRGGEVLLLPFLRSLHHRHRRRCRVCRICGGSKRAAEPRWPPRPLSGRGRWPGQNLPVHGDVPRRAGAMPRARTAIVPWPHDRNYLAARQACAPVETKGDGHHSCGPGAPPHAVVCLPIVARGSAIHLGMILRHPW